MWFRVVSVMLFRIVKLNNLHNNNYCLFIVVNFSEWDIKAYLAAQKEKDKQVRFLMIHKFNRNKNPFIKLFFKQITVITQYTSSFL